MYNTIVVGPLSMLKDQAPLDPKVRRKQARKEIMERRLDSWEARLDVAKTAPLKTRYAIVMAVLYEMTDMAPVLASNDSNPSHQGGNGFGGDGAILKNMVIYAIAGFVISIILKYMGRGELAMMAIVVTGIVVLRQFVFILRELWGDVSAVLSM